MEPKDLKWLIKTVEQYLLIKQLISEIEDCCVLSIGKHELVENKPYFYNTLSVVIKNELEFQLKQI